jgi:hypothetical protein
MLNSEPCFVVEQFASQNILQLDQWLTDSVLQTYLYYRTLCAIHVSSEPDALQCSAKKGVDRSIIRQLTFLLHLERFLIKATHNSASIITSLF